MNGFWQQWLANPGPVLDITLKLSALLASAWLVHFSLRGANLSDLRIDKVRRGGGTLNLSGMTALRQLNLTIGDYGEKEIKKRGGTKKIEGFIHDVRDEDLACLSGLPNLELFWVQTTNPNLTNAALVHVSKLSKLTKLNIGGPKITDKGLECLANLNRLTSLHIGGDFTGDGLRHLEGLKALGGVKVYTDNLLDLESVDRLKSQLPNLTLSSF